MAGAAEGGEAGDPVTNFKRSAARRLGLPLLGDTAVLPPGSL